MKSIIPRKRRTKGKHRKGTSVVEFALVAPILFLLIFGLMEWTRFEMIRHVASTAAFDAARSGTLPNANPTKLSVVANNVLAKYAVTDASVTATLDDDEVFVQVSIPMEQNAWALAAFYGNLTVTRDFTVFK